MTARRRLPNAVEERLHIVIQNPHHELSAVSPQFPQSFSLGASDLCILDPCFPAFTKSPLVRIFEDK